MLVHACERCRWRIKVVHLMMHGRRIHRELLLRLWLRHGMRRGWKGLVLNELRGESVMTALQSGCVWWLSAFEHGHLTEVMTAATSWVTNIIRQGGALFWRVIHRHSVDLMDAGHVRHCIALWVVNRRLFIRISATHRQSIAGRCRCVLKAWQMSHVGYAAVGLFLNDCWSFHSLLKSGHWSRSNHHFVFVLFARVNATRWLRKSSFRWRCGALGRVGIGLWCESFIRRHAWVSTSQKTWRWCLLKAKLFQLHKRTQRKAWCELTWCSEWTWTVTGAIGLIMWCSDVTTYLS